jgi:hypothetical protein
LLLHLVSGHHILLIDWTVGREGLSPIQKCTAAIKMLAYGTPADQLDDNLKLAASTALECLGNFAK